MKFILECDDKILLPFTYDFSEEVEAFLKKTNVLELRKNRDEGLIKTEQGVKNLKAMFKRLCKEYPDETSELLAKLWVLDEGETAPNALVTFSRVISNKEILDFFSSLMQLAQ